MFTSLLGSSGISPTRGQRSPFSMPYNTRAPTIGSRKASDNERGRTPADYDTDSISKVSDEEVTEEDEEQTSGEEDTSESPEDGPDDATPLLPLFSATHLDALPVFDVTHTIRLMVISRCETTLSWDQLRSPQVSQFLLKPIQQEIRTNHFSAATEYALLANCLQFSKEAGLNPGNSGTSRTRAMVCELLAIKLLREHSVRELIDSLSYDFNPLQGQAVDGTQGPANATGNRLTWDVQRKSQTRSARISCLEIAIRAQAKRFLAHPLVVQQLEAIWAGTIVFHAAADSMHRKTASPNMNRGYGTADSGTQLDTSQSTLQPGRQRDSRQDTEITMRRTVVLYNPRDASLFKLSRLRVPRYRNLLSTGSFAILLALFLAVLIQRSLEITTLEVCFWLWASGYMLDEVVGFNEQGFSLYIASFWNTFDLGILIILFVHLCLRIYGIVMPDIKKHTVANMAYDVLAADAILLFPRLFSVLDHYRYFSQLLIAFRMMAADLAAVFVLILISCSGFFVALTLSFGNDGIDTPASVAYALLQMIMGFTPAAWDRWGGYNLLGKTILTLFLFICHFLVVTILITVLTNSFMAIVQNANEEHQFVFAVNTISMVKSDALFSYVAPTNVLAWLLTPLRYFLPFHQFVKVNRTVIKITHFPILFSIYLYERTVLQASVMNSIHLTESRGRSKKLFAAKLPRLARAPSVATFRQDRALEEVFRRPYDSTMRNSQHSQERRKTSNVVSNWMKNLDEVVASPPIDQAGKVGDRVERRSSYRPSRMMSKVRDFTRSVASDPEEFVGHGDLLSPELLPLSTRDTTPLHPNDHVETTDADGDDELGTDDNEDNKTFDRQSVHGNEKLAEAPQHQPDYFSLHTPANRTPELSNSVTSSHKSRLRHHDEVANTGHASPSKLTLSHRPNSHLRNVSSATVVYKPLLETRVEEVASKSGRQSPVKGQDTDRGLTASLVAEQQTSKPTSTATGHRTPKRQFPLASKTRPILPPKDYVGFSSTPNFAGLTMMKKDDDDDKRRRTALEMDLVSDIGDNKAIGGGFVGAIPASFATQMAYANASLREREARDEDRDMFSRLLMARMNSLEEGFREVVHEMRDHLRREEGNSRSRSRNRSSRSRERPGRATHYHHHPRKGKDRVVAVGKGNATTSESTKASSRPDSTLYQDREATTGETQGIKHSTRGTKNGEESGIDASRQGVDDVKAGFVLMDG